MDWLSVDPANDIEQLLLKQAKDGEHFSYNLVEPGVLLLNNFADAFLNKKIDDETYQHEIVDGITRATETLTLHAVAQFFGVDRELFKRLIFDYAFGDDTRTLKEFGTLEAALQDKAQLIAEETAEIEAIRRELGEITFEGNFLSEQEEKDHKAWRDLLKESEEAIVKEGEE